MSARPALNEFNVESTDAVAPAFVPEHLMTTPAPEAAADLARLGVTDVVTATPAAAAHLLTSDRFAVVWADAPWSVLSVAGTPGRPAPSSQLATSGPATAELTSHAADRLAVTVGAPAATPATLAVGWSPRWAVDVDGHRVPAHRSPEGLVAFEVPAGRSTVVARFRPDPWSGVGAMISVLSLIAAVWALRSPEGVFTDSRAPARASAGSA
jgi:hypothetical protein